MDRLVEGPLRTDTLVAVDAARPATPCQSPRVRTWGRSTSQTGAGGTAGNPALMPIDDFGFISRVFMDDLGRVGESAARPQEKPDNWAGMARPVLIHPCLDVNEDNYMLGRIAANRAPEPASASGSVQVRPAGNLPRMPGVVQAERGLELTRDFLNTGPRSGAPLAIRQPVRTSSPLTGCEMRFKSWTNQ